MKTSPLVGFISPPAWYDPAPSEFGRVCREDVRTQQAPILLPDFDYRLESIAGVRDELILCARCLKAMGCEVAAQVGSPFAWACAESEKEARRRNEVLGEAAGIPTIMTSLAIVDALRALGVKRVAANCTYYDPEWKKGFAGFLELCGFSVVHASTLADQGLVPPEADIQEYGWIGTPDLTRRSVAAVCRAAPEAEAIVVTGAGTRTLDILTELEAECGKPIVAADTVLYWAAARELGLTLKPIMGRLATL